MKGCIIINAYKQPYASVLQAERLQKEFLNLGVNVDIVSDGASKTALINGKVKSLINDIDFAIFLDKDKYLSNLLEKSGVRLFNSHNSIRVCDDKAETVIELSKYNLPLPNTVFGPLSYSEDNQVNSEFVDFVIKELNLPVVVKECYGSMGKGIYKAETKKELCSVLDKVKNKPFICQEYISYKKGTDVRIIVVGFKAITSILRVNDKDFRSNVGAGGKGVNFVAPQSFILLAEEISKKLNLDYCGVDLLFKDDATPVICEVNSNAFFEETERVTNKNVAKIYAEYVVNCCKK